MQPIALSVRMNVLMDNAATRTNSTKILATRPKPALRERDGNAQKQA